MGVGFRRSGVPLYSILWDTPPSLCPFSGPLPKRLVNQKVSYGSVPDTLSLEGGDTTPPAKKSGPFIASPTVMRQRSMIAQRYDGYQRPGHPQDKKHESKSESHRV